MGYCPGARWLGVAAILLSATEIVVGSSARGGTFAGKPRRGLPRDGVTTGYREEDVEDERVHEGLVGNKVLVELRNEKGGTYSIVARLRGKSYEGLHLKLQASGRTVTIPRDSVAGIRPLRIRRG